MNADLTVEGTSSQTDTCDLAQGRQLFRDLRLGERQAEGPLAVFPLFTDRDTDGAGNAGPHYIALRQAIAEGRAVITEVSENGSVPELRVVNEGDASILLLEGEEVLGAKQNRVLTTSILVKRRTTLAIPVSCTEQGRWAYASRVFADSEMLAERKLRLAMKGQVHASFLAGMGACADQGRVWAEVEDLHRKHGTSSRTRAMRDAYEEKKPDLDRLLAAFPLIDGQNGVLVLHGSRVIGLDLVSRAKQYAGLHDKLLRSYAFEALVCGGEPGDRPAAKEFLERIAGLSGRRFKSPGAGWDVRFEGAGVLGSVLVYRGHAIHAAFFDVGGASGPAEDRPRADRPSWSISDARQFARRRESR